MRSRAARTDRARPREGKQAQRWSRRRRVGWVGASLGGLALVVALVFVVFGSTILNGYGRRKAERAFAEAHPGCVLQIGKLDYSLVANRLVAQSVTLAATNATLKAGRVSLTGVRWARLLWAKAVAANVLSQSTLEAADLELEFPQAHYGLRCARLRASVPESAMSAEGTELRTLVPDEDFFATHVFRTTRFHVTVPECRVLGLAYDELLKGRTYRARSVRFSRPSLDALVNCDKAPPPFVTSPLMVHEALATIRQPLVIEQLTIDNGRLTYGEQRAPGANPGVLTFGAVALSAEGIANRGDASAAILLRARGDFMDAGVLQVQMSIPVTSSNLSFHYSGSLGAMDLTRLNAFLEVAEHTRIKSGMAQEAAFEIEVTAGQAWGRMRGTYSDLQIAILGKHTGTETGLANLVASFLANLLKVRGSNALDSSGAMKEGTVNYTRCPDEEFLEFAWFALRTGVLDLISH